MVRCINAMLEDNRNSINRCKAELVSMVTTIDRDKCSKFIQKVSKTRFNKVKERTGKKTQFFNKQNQ